jgi:hypothetical protein
MKADTDDLASICRGSLLVAKSGIANLSLDPALESKFFTNSGPPARASFVVSLCGRFACEAKFMGKLHIEKLKAGPPVNTRSP